MNTIVKTIILMLNYIVDGIASIGTPSPKSVGMYCGLKSKIASLESDKMGQVQMMGVLSGITLTISGFATLVLGNYIIYAIMTSIPGLNSSGYNSTRDSISNYVGIVLPLFGLVMMVGGFALILLSLGVLNIINRQ